MTSQEILRAFQAGKLSLEEAKKALTSIDISHTSMLDTLPKDAIAIVGMSGRYPDARNLTEYWDNLVQAKNSIREIPLSRFDIASYYDPNPARSGKIYCKWLGAIDEIEYFDPLFFHISPAEAEGMDPHQRLFLEEGYKAFEDAGYSPALLNHKACGVYLGIASSEYGLQFSQQKAADVDLIGSSSAITAARIAYTLNLKGPAIAIDTACSSSLVATHLACQALRTQEIDMALVGGVSLYLTPDSYVGMCNARMLSPDGQCKAFDASANGFVPGEGIGALVLKRLADAEADHDHIYGLIIGSGMNQDGTTNGITAPSANSQSELIREVYHKYHINPESINYVETHGTGTKLGDPIELEALASVFQEQTQRKQYCAIGSVKSNIGHTSAVSGLAGVQKVLLAIQQKKLVPTLHYQRPNPHFDFEASPFYVNTETQDWHTAMEGTARRAAVSSFGFSGTNVHLVIEEYIPHADVDPWLPRPSYGPLSSGIQSPQPGLERTLAPAGSPERKYTYQTLMSQVEMQQTPSLFVLSAKSEQQLKSYAQDVKRWIQTHQEFVLQDIAFTLQLGREAMDYRLAIVANSREILLQRLEEFVNNQASIGVYTAQVNKNTYESVCLEVNANEDSLLYKWCQEKNLTKIAQIWVQGVNVDWKLLYTLGTASKPHMTIRANPMITSPTLPYRVSLPTYPFARERYWIPATAGTGSMQGPLPTYAQSSTPISADAYVLHPLVQQNISNFFAQQFSSTFRGDEFFLADHVISGQHIMPAVAYLEMARAAVVAASGLALQAGIDAIRLHLRHVVWAHPLIIGSHHITVRITLFPQENGTVVFVINRDDAVGIIQPHSTAHCVTDIGQAQGTILTAPLEEEKVELVYCQGTIQLHSEDTIEARASQSLDLSAVQARCQRQISASECYQRYRELGLNYGPTYQAIEQLSVGTGEVLARFRLPVSPEVGIPVGDCTRPLPYVLHPSILDAVLHASIGLQIEQKKYQGLHVPFALDELEIVSEVPTQGWAWIRQRPHSRQTGAGLVPMPLDIEVCDDAGRVALRLRGLSSRQLPTEENIQTLLLTPEWKEEAVLEQERAQPFQPEDPAPLLIQPLVLLCGFPNISASRIQAQMTSGGHCRSLYSAHLRREHRFQDMVTQLIQELRGLQQSRRLVGAPTTSPLAGKERAAMGVEGMIPTGTSLVQVVVVYEEEQPSLLEALVGVLKTAHLEDFTLKGQLIEIDGQAEESELLAWLRENQLRPYEPHIRYRNGKRWVREWRELNTIQITKRPTRDVGDGGLASPLFSYRHTTLPKVPWKEGGCYLITGGAGGLARIFVQEIARQVETATIILVGRSALSVEQRAQLEAATHVQSSGIHIDYQQVDMNNGPAVHALIQRVLAKSGHLNGIIHAAGMLRDSLLLNKTPEDVQAVLAPKVIGVELLDETSSEIPLDFFILCSSLSAVVGNVGQADYAAANAYLDAFAHARQALVLAGERQGTTVSINWPLWEEGGMQVEAETIQQMREQLGAEAMGTETGIEVLYQALTSGQVQVIVLHGQVERIKQQLLQRSGPVAREVVVLGGPGGFAPLAGFGESPNPPIPQNVLGFCTSAETKEAVVLGGPGGFAPLAGFGESPNPPIPQNVLGFCTSEKEEEGELQERASTYFRKQLAAVIKVPVPHIDATALLADYGFNSIMAIRFTNVLERYFGPLSKTLLFECPTLRSVTEYFLSNYPEQLRRVLRIEEPALVQKPKTLWGIGGFGDTPNPARGASPPGPPSTITSRVSALALLQKGACEAGQVRTATQRDKETHMNDIAIIGVAGRYPQARDLSAFWENLRTGRDCITEIPPERWDYRLYFAVDKTKTGTTYSKWGGFLEGVDEFDPLFFNISPQEAERMDPQERLFLECVMATLEDAGYTRAFSELGSYEKRAMGSAGTSLSNEMRSNVGVFVGVMYEEYQLFGAQAQVQGQPIALAGSPSSIANRVSYVCNFHGPSMAVDTMCSSSLTAIHLACQSIQRGECEMAIAGGVNVSIHPNKYLCLAQGQFVSSNGHCESFGIGADGYVPGEGVGAVLLKPLGQAETDGDHIYGVIKATAINHGGKTNGYTVPNPQAQTEVIGRALSDARIDPRTISYIEAHGTGTVLGDPIEIAGLTHAFQQAGSYVESGEGEEMGGDITSPPFSPTSPTGWCAIGSVKSNIGHAESAAGIAGITKVLLQMRYGQLVPSLHTEVLNPHIDFSATPFVIQRELTAWKRLQVPGASGGKEVPRRAGISSFGAGGSNAHVIIEEYIHSHRAGLDDQELPAEGIPRTSSRPAMIVLSARTEGQLRERVQQLLIWTQDRMVQKPKTFWGMGGFGDTPIGADFSRGLPSAPLFLAASDGRREEKGYLGTPHTLPGELPPPGPPLKSAREASPPGPPISTTSLVSALDNMAYTLQVGREAMEERFALQVDSLTELAEKLERYLCDAEDKNGDWYRGQVKRNDPIRALATDEDGQKIVTAWMSKRKYEKLLEWWVKGLAIDWKLLYTVEAGATSTLPRRISLPTYPFARERYWLPTISLSGRMGEHLHALIAGHATLHPLVQHNTSTLWEQRFSSTFYGDEFFLADHQVLGQHIMPAVAYLEMARAAVQEALGDTATRERLSMDLTDIVWAHPLVVEEQPVTVHITLSPQDTTTIAFIISADAPGEEENAELVYSQGRVVLHAPRSSIANVDLAAVQARCQHATLSGPECYQRIRSLSINYGPAFQGIEQVMVGEEEVLARFRLPKMVSQTHVENGYSKSASKSLPAYMLHPSLLDATLQACIGLQVVPVVGQEAQSSAPVVPFALSALEIVGTLPAQGWAWVRRRPDGTASKVFDIEMCDDEGKVAVRLRGLSTRVLIGEEETQTRLLIPCWKEETIPILPHSEEVDTPIESLVLLYELPDSLTSYIQSQIASEGHGQGLKVHKWHCKQFRREQCFQNAVIQLIQELQHLVQSRPEGQLLVQVVIGSTEEPSFLEALTGVLQTAQQEYPQLRAQLIEIQGKPEEETLLALLRENQHRPYKPYIRYQDGKRWVREWQVVHTGEEGYASDDGGIVQREYVPWKEGGCYLITGGAGGLARLFVQEIASYVETATVILVGRSVLSQELHAHLGRVGRAGLHIDYQQVDVGDGPAVHALIQKVLAQHGHLDGIIHAAGVLRDSLLLNKTPEDVHEVLVPKVIGVELLDEASDALSLDFFILCSSLSAVVGNVGQADYAAANAYLNAFAHQRQAHVLAGKRQGQTLSINWPLWETGGMQIETETRQLMQKRMGIEAMGTQVGMRTLYQALACGQAQVIVLHGQVERIKQRLLHQSAASPMQAIQKVTEEEQQTAAPIGQEVLRERAYTYFKKQLAAVIKLPVQQIDVKAPLEDYGFDSVLALRWISALEDAFGPLSKTLLFEHPTVHSVTEYFLRSYPEQLQGVLRIENDEQYRSNTEKMPPKRVGTGLTPVRVSPKEDDARRVWRTGVNPVPTRFSSTGTDRHARQDKEAQAGDIAIIGVAGRYPGARDLDAFWENLCTGRDCITEIPPERWDYRLYFSSDKNKPGTTYSKWGGFLDGVDEFDPLFFNISPQEAERMDPQERLFLECVYATLEDAGYTRETLSRYQGKGLTGNVGVFVGVMYEEYQLFGAEAQIQGQPTTLAGSPSSIANRVSYFCNFHGPSIAVDTMCSSSLTAIYLACQSIKQGTCGLAIAGGVNVSIHPNKYLGLSQGKFVSSQGTCRSFGLGADGYVPAEGVGAVLLKPLLQAEADGDHIYGVIKASAINHGGKTNGYTVPNPQAQAEVIEQALKDARIDPRTITYIEAHGTGTVLGDPIEIAGLTRAFEQRMQDNAGEKMGGELASPPSSPTSLSGWCAIGSVKSNIGHAESAAGIAGITKVLLQMRYGHLVPSLHAEMLNPHIDFSATPFVVQRELSAWKRPQALVAGEEEEVPRRAGISAFGAGGSNAHVILEEYVERHQRSHQTGLNGELKTNPLLIVLSARTEGQLHKRAQQLLVWCSLWACPIDTKEPVEQAQDWHKAQSLHNLAYTLQVGREALEERLAFQVSSLTELKERLRRYIEGCTEGGDWYRGRVKQNDPIGAFAADEDGQKTVAAWISKGKYEKLLEWWVKGLAVNWKLLYTVEAGGASILPRRIALPTYPFARERYWFPTMARNATMSGASSQASPWDRVSSYTIQHPLPDSFDLPRTLLLTPGWKEETISRQSLAEEALPSTDNHLLVLLCDLPGIEASRLQAKLPQGGRCRSLQSLQPRREQRFQEMIAQMIRELQDLRQSRPVGLVLIQVVVAHRAEPSLLEALVGVLKVAQQEYPKLQGQLIEVDGEPKEGELLTWLRENQFLLPHEFHIRYQDGQRWVREWRELDHAPVGAHPIDVKFAPLREHVPWKNGGCYLITGGAGGLARLFVEEIVRHVQEATIVLVGRSAQSEELRTYLKQVGRAGISIDYQQVDVGVVPCAAPVPCATDGPTVHALIQKVLAQYGHLDGIIHAAGVLHNTRFFDKTEEEVRAVLAPKVIGVELLDEASSQIPLDFFLLCSSLAAVLGGVGYVDYAGANAYLDAFAHTRAAKVLAGERQGRTLSINWPYWKAGGMQMDAETMQMMRELVGEEPMETEMGMKTLYQALASDQAQVIVLHGQVERIKQQLLRQSPDFLGNSRPTPPVESVMGPGRESEQEPAGRGKPLSLVSMDKLREALSRMVCDLLKVQMEEIDVEMELSEYGFDSITLKLFANRLNQSYQLDLTPAHFYEYSTIERLALYLQRTSAAILTSHFVATSTVTPEVPQKDQRQGRGPVAAPTPREQARVANGHVSEPKSLAATQPIAIIGMSGAFPQAPDLPSLWNNLLEGRDCISEIPASRWDWPTSAGSQEASEQLANVKWAGVMEGIEWFDPQFFGISPREAEQMDPQQRLLMMYVWKAIEDAGYAPSSLSGTNTALFVGTASSGYGERLSQAGVAIEGYSATGLAAALGPNRMSHFLNLHGPSEAIDTACSSSLIAVHRGISAIERGECSMSIVGGINTLVSPKAQISLNKAGMLSSDGRCKAFSAEANGFVRSEGVGMLVLKRLAEAEQDGDHIYGVIVGSSENHGGRASSLTAPNPRAQADLLIAAYRKAGIDPRTVGYIEAHGTGTELGDPIEINGLKTAFSKLAQTMGEKPVQDAVCGIGSVKSNIGHLELAAGVAGVIKVLLQMQHKKLVKSLHCERLNPYIQLEASPFSIVQENREWEALQDQAGNTLPRRAGVNAFGFGGANAHVVLEEYVPKAKTVPAASLSQKPLQTFMIVLSAKNEERLNAQVRQLLAWIQAGTGTEEPPRQAQRLQDLAYTLQVGREAMEERLALQVRSLAELSEKLHKYLQDAQGDGDCYRGQVRRQDAYSVFTADEDGQQTIVAWMSKGKYEKLLELWVKGATIDWKPLYGEQRPRRISLPTYPFAQERYWIPTAQGRSEEPLHHAMADETNRNGKTSRAEHRTLVPPNKVALRSLADPSVHPSRSQWADPTDADQSLPPSSLAGFTQSFSSASSKDVGASVQMLEESHHSARVTPQLEKELVRSLAQILYMQESTIPVETPFVEIGLDSVIGVEWIQSLNKQYASQLKVSSLYDYPTIRQMAGLLARAGLKSQHMPVQSLSPLSLEESEPVETVSHACKAGLTNLQSVARRPQARSEAIAIIGMAGKYPAAPNLTDLWDNLVQGKDAIREIPLERWNPADYYDPHPGTPGKISCKWLGALEGIEYFDPFFFHLSPAEAEEMDPQQRLFLQEGYKAFEDAGYSPLLLSNRKCGIYLGISGSEYGLLLAGHKGTDTSFMGTSPAIAAARLAYLLNLKGPAISIDTACSSSLVATHLACQALRTQEIDMALVGGVSLYLTADSYVSMCGAGMLSPDGRCKTFDSRANGFVPAEGVGALVLKRLADAQADHDHIYGLIIGSGMNQDGTTNGITAPSVKSQIELEREIYESYQIDPASMSYVEMHGTGTKLGDPIELEALATVFSEKTEHKQYCAIGSVKSNIGHTSAAAGLVGVHKVLLQMLHKKLVPTLHFAQPNPHFAFEASPFYVNTELRDWKRTSGTPLRAAVSSFGMSGTNVHVVIEEYLASEQATSLTSAPTPSLFVLSANSEPQLQSYAREMRLWIQAHVEQALSDIAYTCQVGRQDMEYRLAIVADTREVLLQRLEAFVDGHPSTQVHTGQVKRRRPGTSSDLISSPDNGTVLFEEDSDAQSLLLLWYQKKKLDKIAQAWVRGITIDWKLLSTAGAVQTPSSLPTASALPQRVSLPTYPFARESYWIPVRHSESGSREVPTVPALSQSSQAQNPLHLSDQRSHADVTKPDEILAFAISYLVNILSTVLKISPEKLDREAGFDEYGLDSILIARLHTMIEGVFGTIPSTTFFQYKCIKDLAHYFLKEHGETLHTLFLQANQPANAVEAWSEASPLSTHLFPSSPRRCAEDGLTPSRSLRSPDPLEQDIAIIGISGQYPQSTDLDTFWNNLESGKDCIIEIPQERWDYHRYYQPNNETGGKTGGMYCKWGGFLRDIDTFDPAFFHISPLEARFMDPQERLFLQTVTACFEDAGYSKHLLRDESAGDGRANIGVFAGVTYNNYQLHLVKEYEQGNVVPINSQTYSIANRVSYIYNLSGPSVALDTACSSSLFAIHLACESIKRGECAMAIAGGVNLSLHPSKYISLCVTQFASSDGRCRSFGQDGDGYVPGEGVGAVLLKPLRDAMADGDHIYAVIKGTAVNNDGKTFGYSVPNPVAQTEVIRKALETAHVHPRTISYVEAHGTGTKLGDPIEVTGLSDAWKLDTSDKQYCAIGSVKSNIGHLEAAAGISQVTKVVLQMKHKKLVPSLLHTSKLNPHIDFENTPFFVQQNLEEWKQPIVHMNGEEVMYPRRAGISSFGAGGVNVHIILEEYQAEKDKDIQEELDKEPVIIVLSAQKEQNLRDAAQLLKAYMEKSLKGAGEMAKLRDVAYTLQAGRDPMQCRLAFTARDVEEIIEKLEVFLNQVAAGEKNGVYIGYSTAEKKHRTEETLDDLETIRTSPGTVEKMAKLWAHGRQIDWKSLYQSERPSKVPLPTYPFSKERYWIGETPFEPPTKAAGAGAGLAPTRVPESSMFLEQLCQALEGERLGMVERYLQDVLAKLLAFNPPDVPELHQGFFDMGMESVMVEQFRVLLEEIFLIDLADTAVFDYPNISDLSEYIVKRIPFSELEKQNSTDASKQEGTFLVDELAILATEDVQEEVQTMKLEDVVYELRTLRDEWTTQ